jgi:hypothetical protein
MAKTSPKPSSTTESTSHSDPKIDTTLPAAVLIAHQNLFLVLFMCLAEKGIMSFAEAAQMLEEAIDAMPDLPQGAQIWLRATLSTLWNLHKDTSPDRFFSH